MNNTIKYIEGIETEMLHRRGLIDEDGGDYSLAVVHSLNSHAVEVRVEILVYAYGIPHTKARRILSDLGLIPKEA